MAQKRGIQLRASGERDIVIQARLSPLRKNLLYLKLVLLSIALGLVFIEHKRVRSERDLSPNHDSPLEK